MRSEDGKKAIEVRDSKTQNNVFRFFKKKMITYSIKGRCFDERKKYVFLQS